MINWSTLSLTFKMGPRLVLPSLDLARACSTAALHHKDIISDLSPVFDSIPELCTASGPLLPTKVVVSAQKTSSVKLGPLSSNSVPPLGSIPWDRHRFSPPALHAWYPSSSWFSASDTFELMVGWVISPATVLPLLREDHINNHLFIGDQPPTTVNTLLCQVKAIPRKSEGIEPFTMVNTPLCQVEAIPRKSEGIEPFTTVNTPPCQVGVTPRKSEGIEPFTTVNTPPCQVGAIPCKSEGIEPFNMVNTPPCSVEVSTSHPINTPSGPLEDASSSLALTSVPITSRVPPVTSPSSPWPVTDPIAPVESSVTPSLCHASPDTTPAPLKTTQATSHEKPVDIPIRSERPRSAFIEEVDDKDAFVKPLRPEPIGHSTVQHVDDSDPFDEPSTHDRPCPSATGKDPVDVLSPNPNDDNIPPLGDPEHEFFGENMPPSISLIGAAAFKRLIDTGEEVYTINIQPTSDYQDIEALRAVGNTPTPTTALHSEPLPTDEAELFAKVVPEVYQDFFDVFSWEEAKNMPPHREFDHEIHLENDQMPPCSHIYPLSGMDLGLLHEFLDYMLRKGFIQLSWSPAGDPVLFMKKKDGNLLLCVDFKNLNKLTRTDQYPIPHHQ